VIYVGMAAVSVTRRTYMYISLGIVTGRLSGMATWIGSQPVGQLQSNPSATHLPFSYEVLEDGLQKDRSDPFLHTKQITDFEKPLTGIHIFHSGLQTSTYISPVHQSSCSSTVQWTESWSLWSVQQGSKAAPSSKHRSMTITTPSAALHAMSHPKLPVL